MNFTQLTAFRAVMTTRSLSEAARKIGRTQPAVSLAVRSLEDDIGLSLFERRGGRLVPAPEAQYLLIEAEAILDRLTSVSRTMQSLAAGRSGVLNLAAMPGPAAFVFPRFVSDVIGDNDEIKLSISSRSSLQIQELAATQTIDFGFADAPAGPFHNAQYLAEIISADCFCALPKDHPLASQGAVSIRDLDGLPMGTLQPNHALQLRLQQRFHDMNARLSKRIDSQTFLPLLQFVGAGRCVAIVDPLTVISEGFVDTAKGLVVFRPLKEALRYDYAIVSPKHRPLSQLAQRVLRAWRAELTALLNGIAANPETGGAPTGLAQGENSDET